MVQLAIVCIVLGVVLLIMALPKRGQSVEMGAGGINAKLPEISGWPRFVLFILSVILLGFGIAVGVTEFMHTVEPSRANVSTPTPTLVPTDASLLTFTAIAVVTTTAIPTVTAADLIPATPTATLPPAVENSSTPTSSATETPTPPTAVSQPQGSVNQLPDIFLGRQLGDSSGNTDFPISLAAGQAIVGQSWSFAIKAPATLADDAWSETCSVFALLGPGDFTMWLNAGGYIGYAPVQSFDQLQSLLNAEVESVRKHEPVQCATVNVRYVTIDQVQREDVASKPIIRTEEAMFGGASILNNVSVVEVIGGCATFLGSKGSQEDGLIVCNRREDLGQSSYWNDTIKRVSIECLDTSPLVLKVWAESPPIAPDFEATYCQ